MYFGKVERRSEVRRGDLGRAKFCDRIMFWPCNFLKCFQVAKNPKPHILRLTLGALLGATWTVRVTSSMSLCRLLGRIERMQNCLPECSGIAVCDDEYLQSTLWGMNLYQHLQMIYKDKARYCVVFVSENYIKKNWTKHEL
jgi:hypothetical protein